MIIKSNALIFDVDGTLAETEREGHRIAFNLAFRDSGLDWNWSIRLYGQLLKIGGGKERIQYYIENYLPPESRRPNDWESIKRVHALKNNYYLQLLKDGVIPLRPGVKRLIYEAKQANLGLAIATTSSYANVVTLIEETLGPEVLSWFSVIAAGDIVAQKKPAPDIYHYVLQQLRLEPDRCLVFEDSAQGVRAAIAANLQVIMILNDYTIHDLADLNPEVQPVIALNHLGEPDYPCQCLGGKIELPKKYLDVKLCQSLFYREMGLSHPTNLMTET